MKPGFQTSEGIITTLKTLSPFITIVLVKFGVNGDDVVMCAGFFVAAIQAVMALIAHLKYIDGRVRLKLQEGSSVQPPVSPK